MRVIPKLHCYETNNLGKCDISSIDAIHLDSKFNDSKDYIISIFEKGLNKKLIDKRGSIDFVCDTTFDKEAYKIELFTDRVIVKASTASGAVYATQTIRLLFDFDLGVHSVTCGVIKDAPAMSWRGLLYDEVRHFFGMEHTKQLLDMMALHKLNVLHWHLTDNQGWRVEIKKYPRLVEIGSKREQTQINGWLSTDGDGKPHEGYYTQEQIKEILAYGKERGIRIIPEIDMPGHFAAAAAAYNDLTCRTLDRPVQWYFSHKIPTAVLKIPDWNRAACVANQKTMQFAKDVIDEVMDLFEFPYFHIGGDETPMGEWKKCPKCQALMKEKGYTDEKELQAYFINEIKKHVESRKGTLVGWNEILKGELPDKSVVVQYWQPQPDFKVNKHLKNGGKIIISKHKYFYFDMTYSQYQLQNTYKFNPTKMYTVNKKYIDRVLGVEGAMWTEWLQNVDKFNFHLYPRLQALAEVAWYQGKKDFPEFMERVHEVEKLLDKWGIMYAKDYVATKLPKLKRAHIFKTWWNGDQEIEFRMNQNK